MLRDVATLCVAAGGGALVASGSLAVFAGDTRALEALVERPLASLKIQFFHWFGLLMTKFSSSSSQARAGLPLHQSDACDLDMTRVGALGRREDSAFAASNAAKRSRRSVPVTVVAGPLGSGKTTLTTRAVNCPKDFRLGVIVNDFAQLNVDHIKLSEEAAAAQASLNESSERSPKVVELSGGCVCCSLSNGLTAAVRALVETGDAKSVDYIVVETSGLTDPVEMARLIEYEIDCGVRLDSVVVVVDADNWKVQLESKPEQFLHADVVLLNKIDLLSQTETRDALEHLRGTSRAHVIGCSFGDVPLESVMDVVRSEPEREAFGRIPQSRGERASLGVYSIPSSGGNLVRRAQLTQPNNVHHKPHFNGNVDSSCKLSWHTLSFHSSQGFRLDELQRLILDNDKFVNCISRIKGQVFFQQVANRKFSLQVSGNWRIDVNDLGLWRAAPQVALAIVVYGDDKIVDELESRLQAAASSIKSVHLDDESDAETKRLIREVESTGNWSLGNVDLGSGTIQVRLTGQRSYGLTPEQLNLRFGVDVDQLQKTCSKCINASGKCILSVLQLTREQGQADDTCYLLLSLPHLRQNTQRLVDVLDSAAKIAFRTNMAHVRLCGCD